MIFNSNVFLVFFLAFILLYWLVRARDDRRNWLVFASSVFFYGWWDWRFVGLLLFTGGLDFLLAKKIESEPEQRIRKRWVSLSLISNLGVLGFFKYAGFFVDSAAAALTNLGIPVSHHLLAIVLPAGISFYTFQALAYTIDVYRGHMSAERDPIRYFAFLTFFPQLVAGPIERASFLMTQFRDTRRVTEDSVTKGIWLVLWGFFLKVGIADYLAPLVDLAFATKNSGGGLVLLGTLAFGGQIYCDFAGYSTIARGIANMLGFELSPNFAQPYLATNIQEFWRRWHQTLSTWFRDYIYFPLGGDRRGPTRTMLNVLITFLLAGLWHGANWTFVAWGLWHGLALGGYRLWKASALGGNWNFPKAIGWLSTMCFVGIGWLFFRATSLVHATSLLKSCWADAAPEWVFTYALAVLPCIGAILAIDLFHRRFPVERMVQCPLAVRVLIQGLLLTLIVARWGKELPSFIYFQF